MRIIGGQFRSRRFNPPAKNWPTRPTTDFAKEGLFNILMNQIDFDETKMLDLFGGTGNHCYEFLSRHCTDVTYVDKYYPCVQFVKSIAAELKVENFIRIIKSDVFRYIQNCEEAFDYIFAGPPYPLENLKDIPDLVFSQKILAEGGLLVVEHDSANNFEKHPRFVQSRNYGSAIFSFFE